MCRALCLHMNNQSIKHHSRKDYPLNRHYTFIKSQLLTKQIGGCLRWEWGVTAGGHRMLEMF